MPRKTSQVIFFAMMVLQGFNEAAARCRGKLGNAMSAITTTRNASMRPRPDAAENSTIGPAVRLPARRLQ